MSKFHINKHGVPVPCKAKEGNCPLGGQETHFSSQEEAQAYIDKKCEQEHGLLPDVEVQQTPEQKIAFDKKLNEFEEKMSAISYSAEDCSPETSDHSLDSVVENYFLAVVENHPCDEADLSKYEHDWVEELEDNKDAYERDDDYYDYENGGGQQAGWTEESQEDFDADMDKAEENNDNFEDYKIFINQVVEEAKSIDWTKYGKSQVDGEIEAIDKIRNSDCW